MPIIVDVAPDAITDSVEVDVADVTRIQPWYTLGSGAQLDPPAAGQNYRDLEVQVSFAADATPLVGQQEFDVIVRRTQAGGTDAWSPTVRLELWDSGVRFFTSSTFDVPVSPDPLELAVIVPAHHFLGRVPQNVELRVVTEHTHGMNPLAPTAVAVINAVPSDVTYIDESPDTPDDLWIEWNGTGGISPVFCRVDFPTPPSTLLTGVALQRFRWRLRLGDPAAPATDSTFDHDLYEGGILKGTIQSGLVSANQIEDGSWDAALLADASGANAQATIAQTTLGRNNGIDIGAVEWWPALATPGDARSVSVAAIRWRRRQASLPLGVGEKIMTVTKEQIVNLALIKLGATPILSFDDDSLEGRLARASYEHYRDAELRAHPWNFALEQQSLVAASNTPAFGFSYAYDLPEAPDKCLRVLRVNEEDENTDLWEVHGRQLFTDFGSPILIEYIKQETNVSRYDVLFVDCLASRLAKEWAEAITKASTAKQEAREDYKESVTLGRAVDGQEAIGNKIIATTWDRSR